MVKLNSAEDNVAWSLECHNTPTFNLRRWHLMMMIVMQMIHLFFWLT